MATYNGTRYLREQLESLAAQSLAPCELQVGDDGSTDGTIELIRDFAAHAPFPVHIHQNSERLGFGENFLRVAERCSGDWIAFSDQDDVWLPEKLSVCQRMIDEGPRYLMLVAHNATVTDEALKQVGTLYYRPRPATFERMTLEPEWLRAGFTLVFRRDLVQDIPLAPRPSFPWRPEQQPHDIWIPLLANALGAISISGEELALYRRHGATATVGRHGSSLWRRAVWRLSSQGISDLDRSHYLRTAADLLEDRARRTARSDFAALLLDAAGKIRLQSGFAEMRVAVRSAKTIGQRARALTGLAQSGGYIGAKGWPYGLGPLLKDLILLGWSRPQNEI